MDSEFFIIYILKEEVQVDGCNFDDQWLVNIDMEIYVVFYCWFWMGFQFFFKIY